MDHFNRKIIHIDMDAFFASVEQRDNPDLRGKPIAVGGGEKRGVTTTASYEARTFGVRSAMPGYMAKQMCPELIFVKPRFAAYREVSIQIREIFKNYTDLIEPLSLDEAYLDVTANKLNIDIATEIAQRIKDDILSVSQLTCSAGVSYCKFLAKVASDMNKPDGLTIISPRKGLHFIENLPIEKFFGVGKVTAAKMKNMGIYYGKDLQKWSKKYLIQNFGKTGGYFFDISRGIDHRLVQPDRNRKSLGVERTFEKDLSEFDEILPSFEGIIQNFHERLLKSGNFGRTITLKLKTFDFRTISRSRTFNHYVRDRDEIENISKDLLKENLTEGIKIRLVGLTASNLEKDITKNDTGQLTMGF